MPTKPWYLSKTIWLSILMIIGGVFEFIAGLPPGASAATIIAGIANVLLRLLPQIPVDGSLAAKAMRKQK